MNNPYINKHLETEKKLNTKFELPICLMPVEPIPRGYAKSRFDMKCAEEYLAWLFLKNSKGD